MTNFKVKDFKGSGQYLIYDRNYDPQRKSYLSTLVYKVGWKMNPEHRVTMTSMTDGWTKEGYIEGEGEDAKFIPWENKKQFVAWLNSLKGRREYRWASKEEVLVACTYNKERLKGEGIVKLEDSQECDLCGKQTDPLSGDPTKWQVELPSPGGAPKFYHYGCLTTTIQEYKDEYHV